jgi:CheY-like chemotaxis protein
MKQILLVDDNAINLKLISFVLRRDGFECHTAGSAEQALEMLADFLPDLVLLDVQLPGMSGLDLTRMLRLKRETKDLIILAITASAMKGDQEAAMAAGFDGFLTKPINTRELSGLINGYLTDSAGAFPTAV